MLRIVFNELSLFVELLGGLAGALLFTHLAAAVVRRRRVLPGNWPLRAGLVALALWHVATLVDQQLFFLLGHRLTSHLGTGLDLLRALAWLLIPAFVAHTLERALSLELLAQRPGWLRFLPLVGYAPMLLFLPSALEFARAGRPDLAVAVGEIYPLVRWQATLSLVLGIGLASAVIRQLDAPRLSRFLRALQWSLALVLAVIWLAADPAVWTADASGGARLLRSAVISVWLVPGALFAFFVQRFNLLHLTLSFRALRLFVAVILLATVVTFAGPALGIDDPVVVRRMVAWGLMLALVSGIAYLPLMDRALGRSEWLRSFMGRRVTTQELDSLMDRIDTLEDSERSARQTTADQLTRWLAAPVRFLPPADGQNERLWRYFENSDAVMIERLDTPDRELSRELAAQRLVAVFPLRVDGRLEGLLGVSESAFGGGYVDGELEGVRLVMRQLQSALSQRRRVAERLTTERRLAEHERLSLLGLVSASLAHEIKNPLSAMKALAQALREDLAADDPASEGVADLDVIVEQIDRLDSTTREILGIARPQTSDRCALSEVARSALYVLDAEARKRGVHLQHSLADVGESIPGSAASWQTVIFNLVLNALQHTAAGETVEVTLGREPEGELIFVTANPGSPLESPGRLWQPFVSTGGTGLGLSLVQRRVEEIGATVDTDHEQGRVIFRVVLGPDAETAAANSTSELERQP